MQKQYSGERSRRFWDRINALPEPFRDELYGMGCLIQDYEHVLMRKLEKAEKASGRVVTMNKCKCQNRHCQAEIDQPGRCEQCREAWENTCKVAQEAFAHQQSV